MWHKDFTKSSVTFRTDIQKILAPPALHLNCNFYYHRIHSGNTFSDSNVKFIFCLNTVYILILHQNRHFQYRYIQHNKHYQFSASYSTFNIKYQWSNAFSYSTLTATFIITVYSAVALYFYTLMSQLSSVQHSSNLLYSTTTATSSTIRYSTIMIISTPP